MNSDTPEKLRALLAAAPDHAAIARVLVSGVARWEPGTREFCIGGIRHSTELDEFGVPIMTSGMREAILKADGAKPDKV